MACGMNSMALCLSGHFVCNSTYWACLQCEDPFVASADGKECQLPAEQTFNAIVTLVGIVLLAVISAAISSQCYLQRCSYLRGKPAEDADGLLNIQEPLMEYDIAEVFKAGAIHYRNSLMGVLWHEPMRRIRTVHIRDIFVDVHLKNVIGKGLALYYDFQVLPIFCAFATSMVTGYAAHASGYERRVVAATQANYSEESAKAVWESSKLFAENLWVGLMFLWVVMVLFSWLQAYTDVAVMEVGFDDFNSTMADYAVELKNLPTTWNNEQHLLQACKMKLAESGCDPFGVSIGYDIRHESRVAQLIEHIIVQTDVELGEQGVSTDDPEENRWGTTPTPHFGYRETLACPCGAEVAIPGPEAEAAMLQDVLDGLTCSGHAWMVFRYKEEAAKVASTFTALWFDEAVPFREEERMLWVEALQPPQLSDYESGDLWHIWPSGQATIVKDLYLYHDSHDSTAKQLQFIPKGTRVTLPGDQHNTCGNLVRNVGESITIQRAVTVKPCSKEPLTVMWESLGTPNIEITANTLKAMGITFGVFVLIAVLVYLPFTYFIDMPYSKAKASPGVLTCQVKGLLVGIASNVVGSVMGMQAWGVGFSNRWALDVWVNVFNFGTSLVNTSIFLFTFFFYQVEHLTKSFLELKGLIPDDTKLIQTAVTNEIHLSAMLFDMMYPGWLWSGWIIGRVVGFVVPWIQNSLLLYLVFACRILPDPINRIIALIIPYNPDPQMKLTARMAEKIFAPGPILLCWEYADKILTPSICLMTLFFLSPQMWRIFPQLMVWASGMYLYHRFFQIWLHGKCIHDSRRLGISSLYLWFLPLGMIASAWAFWTIRLGYVQDPFIFVPIAFLTSTIIYWMGLFAIIPSRSSKRERDKPYEFVNMRLLYNWFNCNPVHVLKSRYEMLQRKYGLVSSLHNRGELHPTPAPIPFTFGKEYQIINTRSFEEEKQWREFLVYRAKYDTEAGYTIANAKFDAKKYGVPIVCLIILIVAQVCYMWKADTNITSQGRHGHDSAI
mmetsp:Transcript_48264/g.134771  ORF Transcript_48264/g.134771 Transcript_48264/m.134771 type:complete len:1007 (-) Transcript_48264:126-3146(-)